MNALRQLSHFLAVFGWIVAVALVGSAPGGQPNASANRPDPSFGCGALSLATLLTLEGVPVGPDRIAASLPDRSEHSMVELIAAAREQGVALRGVRLNRQDWPLDRPALVHLNQHGIGHFVVVRPVGSSGRLIQAVDPIQGVEIKEVDPFFASDQWTGAALVPTRIGDFRLIQPAMLVGSLLLGLWGFWLIRRRVRKFGADDASTTVGFQ